MFDITAIYPHKQKFSATLSCQYRIYAVTNYELFAGFSREIEEDLTLEQPVWNEDYHLVARINKLEFPDPENIFAEAIIWRNDLRNKDKREVLYASNGVYRDGCDYNLYFGLWHCEWPNQFFYIDIYAEDPNGLTVRRTTQGHCSVRIPTPPDNGCRNGGADIGNGKCLCTPGWKGDKCQDIVCYNNGLEESTHCSCVAPYSGRHCEKVRCDVS